MKQRPLSPRAPRVNAIIHRDRSYLGVHDAPRPMDPSARLRAHGRVRPMEQPGWFARLLGAR